MRMIKSVIAEYVAYSHFVIPDGVLLLCKEDNESADEGSPGYWFIKWNVLNYYDKDSVLQTILSQRDEVCADYKRPVSLEIEEVNVAVKDTPPFDTKWTLTEIPQFMMDEIISQSK
jgi:hypothetical protein